MPPVEIGRAILKTALARATAGTEGARLVGAQLSGVAGTTVQAMLEGLKTLVDGKVDGTDGRLSDARTPKDASVTNTKVDAAAAIAESKLALASDAAVNVASRRTLGTGATQALPGNHSSTTNARTPTDGSVTRAKMSQDNRGTIICTSTTRPTGTDAPEGQPIYETDTDARLWNTGTPAAPVWSALGGGGGGAPEYAVVKRGAAQSTTSGQWNPIDWDTETADPNGWFDPLNPRRVTLPAGTFSAQAGSCFAANATGLRSMRIEHYNSAGALLALYEVEVVSAGVDANGRAFPAGFIVASAGDFLQAAAFQNSGGALNFVAPAGFPVPHLTVWRVK